MVTFEIVKTDTSKYVHFTEFMKNKYVSSISLKQLDSLSMRPETCQISLPSNTPEIAEFVSINHPLHSYYTSVLML